MYFSSVYAPTDLSNVFTPTDHSLNVMSTTKYSIVYSFDLSSINAYSFVYFSWLPNSVLQTNYYR